MENRISVGEREKGPLPERRKEEKSKKRAEKEQKMSRREDTLVS